MSSVIRRPSRGKLFFYKNRKRLFQMTHNNTLAVVPVYCWSKPDHQYNDVHDDYQQRMIGDFHAPAPCRFACSFRNVGNSREGTIKFCCNPQCSIKNNTPGGRPCQMRERLTAAKPVNNLPRWQIIQLNVHLANKDLPNDDEANRASFVQLSVKPHATLDLHGYYEQNRSDKDGLPQWNVDDVRSYKLRGYVVLSSNFSKYKTLGNTSTIAVQYFFCPGGKGRVDRPGKERGMVRGIPSPLRSPLPFGENSFFILEYSRFTAVSLSRFRFFFQSVFSVFGSGNEPQFLR